jgi:ribosomal protein RSM22 (predicted rRNA methylase)
MAPPKRPRVKTAEDIFADENKTKITKAMSQKRAQDGSTTEVNLPDYNRLKKELFLALPETERANYQKKASDHKDLLQGEPDPSHVFEFVYQTIRFFELTIYLFPEIRRL